MGRKNKTGLAFRQERLVASFVRLNKNSGVWIIAETANEDITCRRQPLTKSTRHQTATDKISEKKLRKNRISKCSGGTSHG